MPKQMSNMLASATTEELMAEMQRRLYCAKQPEKRVILVGPPGSGKGTQAHKLKKAGCLCHLATGDMLRAAVAAGSPYGKQADKTMKAGGLVADHIVVGIIQEHLSKPECKNGFILDGFPRNIPQAKALDQLLKSTGQKLDAVVSLEIDDSEVKERILGRLIHKPSGRSYHTKFKPPLKPMTDDVTGEPLIHRGDDNETTLAKRLGKFHKMTEPVIAYYGQQGVLKPVNADNSLEGVYHDALNAAFGRDK